MPQNYFIEGLLGIICTLFGKVSEWKMRQVLFYFAQRKTNNLQIAALVPSLGAAPPSHSGGDPLQEFFVICLTFAQP